MSNPMDNVREKLDSECARLALLQEKHEILVQDYPFLALEADRVSSEMNLARKEIARLESVLMRHGW